MCICIHVYVYMYIYLYINIYMTSIFPAPSQHSRDFRFAAFSAGWARARGVVMSASARPEVRSIGTQTVESSFPQVPEPEAEEDQEASSSALGKADLPAPAGGRALDWENVLRLPAETRFYAVWALEGQEWRGIACCVPPAPWERLRRLLPGERYTPQTCRLRRAKSAEEAWALYVNEPGADRYPVCWLLQ